MALRIARDLYVDECHTSSKEKIPTVQADDTFPVKGSIVYNTDTDSIWFGNGSEWAPLGSEIQITAVESTGMPPGTFGITATPNPITGTGTIALADTFVTPGDYTSANIRVDQQGRITLVSNGTGGITELTAIASTGGTLAITATPDPIIGVGTIALADTAVAPGTYTSANITVDQQGRLTFAEDGSTIPVYPLAPIVGFSGTVNTNGTSTFPGASVARSPGSSTGTGAFRITSYFIKQQIGPSLFEVTLRLNIGIAAFGMTQGGLFTFTINSNPAGFNFPAYNTFHLAKDTFSAWTPYYTGTADPYSQLKSKMRLRFTSPTQIVGVSSWIGFFLSPGNVFGNEGVPIEMDTVQFTYYTDV